ncbi:glycosyltransferase [Thalassotalea sp. PLHSN55]|uniref:glycosyltransferase n=1 Tax=Thalassotalea sp. PLHSN55 TaxID=3435888 RepID=UPI003F876084
MMTVAKDIGLNAIFIGANRESDLPSKDSWDGMEVNRVGQFYPMLNGSAFFTYLRGVFSYNVNSYKFLKKERPELIHVSDVESFPAAFVYKLFNRTALLYNIHDNLAQRYALPRAINGALNILEGLIVKYADATLVPEVFRATSLPKFCQKKISVIRNTPIDPGKEPPREKDDTIRIVFAGWLDSGRGIDTLLELANLMPNVQLLIAGEGDDEIVKKVSSVPNCKYFGFLDHEKVLELTKSADYVFAHYSPHRIINRYAAPNKLAESLAVGRPVIINKEALVSRLVVESNCGIVTKYGDAESIKQEILALEDNEFDCMCERARNLFEKEYSWEKVKLASQQVLLKLLERK